MLLTALLYVSLFFLSCAQKRPDFPQEYVDGLQEDGKELTYDEYLKKRNEDINKIAPPTKAPCDVPVCSTVPCERSGPPPFCPRDVKLCRSGCASIEYCKDHLNRLYYYEVKFCRTPRRFTPDDNFFSTSKMPFGFD